MVKQTTRFPFRATINGRPCTVHADRIVYDDGGTTRTKGD